MNDHGAIDMWAPIVPMPEVMAHVADNFPKEMVGYLRVFYKREPRLDEFSAAAKALKMPEADVIAALDAAGLDRSLITGFDEFSSCGKTFIPNDLVAGIAERHPDRFIPFAGADLGRGMPAVREFEGLVRDHGFEGLSACARS